MNIILPILFFAACLGLFARRITAGHWWTMACVIMLVIGYYYVKH